LRNYFAWLQIGVRKAMREQSKTLLGDPSRNPHTPCTAAARDSRRLSHRWPNGISLRVLSGTLIASRSLGRKPRGDVAHALDADGRPLPGVAPEQQGRYVASLLKARMRDAPLPPFRYRDFGAMATVGRKRAVVQLARLKLTGLPAWVLWSIAHIYFLIVFRNRLLVAMNWG
jgi:hypothetical protein